MAPITQKGFARSILLLAVLIAGSLLAWTGAPHRISTDVLDLMPNDKGAPEIALIRGMAGDRQARVVLIQLKPGLPSSGAKGIDAGVGNAVIGALRGSGAFEDVELLESSSSRDAVGASVFNQRLDLLGPGWLADQWNQHQKVAPTAPWSAWLAEATAARLEDFLSKPEAMGFQDLLKSDPLLLVPNLAEQLEGFEDPGAAKTGSGTLIWALSRDDPLSKEGQAAISDGIDQASRALSAGAPGSEVLWTGVSRLAENSRRRIEGEVSRLNLLSLAAVLAVAVACVRRPARALLLAPVVLLSMLGAWTAVALVFAKVHVLVFVIGSLLCGVAIDYGFYIFLQPPRPLDESYRSKVQRLLRPLLSSSLTVVLGFSLLTASDLPLIRQVGVFVSGGLLAALASAILWFAQIDSPYLETRPFVRARLRPHALGHLPKGIIVLAATLTLVGILRLTWRDDIHDLQVPGADLDSNDKAIRGLFGDTASRTVYITQGNSPRRARESLQRFDEWHQRKFPETAALSLGALLPKPADWDGLSDRLKGLGAFEPDLRAALARHGFSADSFDEFFRQWKEWSGRTSTPSYDSLVREFAQSLSGPLSLAISINPNDCRFITVANHAPGVEPPPETSTFSNRQLESLNSLLRRYRVSALRLSSLGLAIVGLSVFLIYGVRHGVLIFSIPCGSCLFAFGILGILGRPIDLFHLLGAFLGVCLAHNYAIFTWENSQRGETPPPSIRLSAFCTAASFGVLGLSTIPVVAALGSTVALVVLSALAAVEILPHLGNR